MEKFSSFTTALKRCNVSIPNPPHLFVMCNKLGLHVARHQIYSSQNLSCLQTPNSAGCVNTRGTWNKTTSFSKINIVTNDSITSWVKVTSPNTYRSKQRWEQHRTKIKNVKQPAAFHACKWPKPFSCRNSLPHRNKVQIAHVCFNLLRSLMQLWDQLSQPLHLLCMPNPKFNQCFDGVIINWLLPWAEGGVSSKALKRWDM